MKIKIDSSNIILYATITGVVVGAIGVAFAAGTFYMDFSSFTEKQNVKKHNRELNEFIQDLKKQPQVSTNFNPVINTEIKDFDFTMKLEIDENTGLSTLNNTINGYNAGQFSLSTNPDGKAILKIIEFKLNEIITDNNLVIKVKARGAADGIPVTTRSIYKGELGDYLNIKYFIYNKPYSEKSAIFISGQTKMKNEYYALLRAYDVVNQLKMKYPINEENIKIYVQEYSEIGPEFRKCDLSITVEKAFLKEYNELNKVTKFLVNEF